MLSSIFLLAGCGGGSQSGTQHRARKEGHSAKLALRPEGGSGVSGTASFQKASGGVAVNLSMRDLPEPGTLYLAHIHPGTCAEGEEEEHHEHGGRHGEEEEHHERGEHVEDGEDHEHGDEIEYPLTQVKSNSEGKGSSSTTLHDTSIGKLFSGEPKHVNVHEAGAGDPPVLSCADLKRAG